MVIARASGSKSCMAGVVRLHMALAVSPLSLCCQQPSCNQHTGLSGSCGVSGLCACCGEECGKSNGCHALLTPAVGACLLTCSGHCYMRAAELQYILATQSILAMQPAYLG